MKRLIEKHPHVFAVLLYYFLFGFKHKHPVKYNIKLVFLCDFHNMMIKKLGLPVEHNIYSCNGKIFIIKNNTEFIYENTD